MPLHYSCYDILSPCLLCCSWAYGLKCLPYQFHTLFLPNISVGSIHIISRASLAHFILWESFSSFHSLGILSSFHSFLLLTFSWALAKSFGLPWPYYHILPLGLLAFEPILFTNFFLWATPASFCFLSISYDSYRLATSFFGASLARLLSPGLHYYFVGL